jgi:hypothetical protein
MKRNERRKKEERKKIDNWYILRRDTVKRDSAHSELHFIVTVI